MTIESQNLKPEANAPTEGQNLKKTSPLKALKIGGGRKKTDRQKAAALVQGAHAKYPRHTVDKVLRIPRAILEQNAGKDCTDRETAGFIGVGFGGPHQLEISSAIKYGFLERPAPGRVNVTELARKVLRPQHPEDETAGLRQAIQNAPDFSEVYNHYRGENLPDRKFFENALADKFGIPKEKISEFIAIFIPSLEAAKLIEKTGDKCRSTDVSKDATTTGEDTGRIQKLSRDVHIEAHDTCFVMMAFAPPIGDYYTKVYEPAIRKAGLRPVRADSEIFGTGKVMEQIWSGIRSAKVLVAELTKRNPNVFYELGLAHALQKPRLS